MHAPDTNVLIRLLVRDDPLQLAVAEEFVDSGVWVSLLVLMETVWVLESVYKRKPEQIAEGLEMLLNAEQISVQDTQIARDALCLYRKHPKVGFSDCLILEVARSTGHLPVGIFDRQLGKLAGTQLLAG